MISNNPKKLNPDKIIDSVVEIRYESGVDGDAQFGMIFNVIPDEFKKNVEKLPILELPATIRKKDPNFQHKPYFRLKNDNFVLQFGPGVIVVSSYPIYVGWLKFFPFIENILNEIYKTRVIDVVKRIGIRYINFFEVDIFKEINFDFSFMGISELNKGSVFKTIVERGGFYNSINISNNVTIGDKNGSVLDIDTFSENRIQNKSEVLSLLSSAHDAEKNIFFNILKKDYIKKLNPEY